MKCASLLFITDKQEVFTELHQLLAEYNFSLEYLPASKSSLADLFLVKPDVILLDCAEESVVELTLCQQLRTLYAGPLMLLSSQQREQFTLLALNLGADIAFSTQSSAAITAASIKSLLHRFGSFSSFVLKFGDLTIDARIRDAFLAGKRVHLSTVEFELLWLLGRRAGQVVSREIIHLELYNSAYNGYDRNIDLYISRIRHKLGDSPESPEYLRTVRGAGYHFMGISEE